MKKAAKSAYKSHTPKKEEPILIPESEGAVETFVRLTKCLKPHRKKVSMIFEQDFLYELAKEIEYLTALSRIVLR
jgi:hypothetical protein